MISTGELRRGVTIEIDGTLYQVIEYNHIKMGRGSAQVRMRLKDVRAGHIIERTWPAGSKFQRARVERQPAQYLYSEGDIFYFMNKETFDQIAMNRDVAADQLHFLKENEECTVLTYGDEAIGIELPASVILTVSEAEPGMRGDTAQGGTKPATMETGLVVQVPLFVGIGDRLKIDTRSGAYLERA